MVGPGTSLTTACRIMELWHSAGGEGEDMKALLSEKARTVLADPASRTALRSVVSGKAKAGVVNGPAFAQVKSGSAVIVVKEVRKVR